MNDLPIPTGNSQISTNSPIRQPADQSTNTAQVIGNTGAGGKEREGVSLASAEMPQVREIGKDVPLPPEVSAVGVRVQPTTIPIPPTVAQMGLKPAGPNVPLGTGSTVTLPLTDDQIAAGLHQSIKSSWRWLAEWCVRRLKQLHVALKSIHGKLMRVNV